MISATKFIAWLEKKATPLHYDRDGTHHNVYMDDDVTSKYLPNLDDKDHSLSIDMHGGGAPLYMIGSTPQMDEGSIEMPKPFHSTVDWGKEGYPELLNKLRHEDINKVHSIACNMDGGGTPDFYEKLLGHKLDKVTMTPPGYAGVAGQHTTNLLSNGVNTYKQLSGDDNIPMSAPQHTYGRVQDKFLGMNTGHHWKDDGEYHTSLDNFAGHAVLPLLGAGTAGLAYALYRKMQNKHKLEKVKHHIVK